jgi:hypothetical protein
MKDAAVSGPSHHFVEKNQSNIVPNISHSSNDVLVPCCVLVYNITMCEIQHYEFP